MKYNVCAICSSILFVQWCTSAQLSSKALEIRFEFNSIQFNSIQFTATPQPTRHRNVIWRDLMWRDVVQYDVIQCDTTQCLEYSLDVNLSISGATQLTLQQHNDFDTESESFKMPRTDWLTDWLRGTKSTLPSPLLSPPLPLLSPLLSSSLLSLSTDWRMEWNGLDCVLPFVRALLILSLLYHDTQSRILRSYINHKLRVHSLQHCTELHYTSLNCYCRYDKMPSNSYSSD